MNLKFTDTTNRSVSMVYFNSESEGVCNAIGKLIAMLKIHPDGVVFFQRVDNNPLAQARYEVVVPKHGNVYIKART